MSATPTKIDNLIVLMNELLDDDGTSWPDTVAGMGAITPQANAKQWALNRAVDVFQIRTKAYRVSVPIVLSANTIIYKLQDTNGVAPSGEVLRIEDEAGNVVYRTTTAKLDQLEGAWSGGQAALATPAASGGGKPDRATRWIRGLDGFASVRFFPPPRKTVTYQAYFAPRPTPMSATGQYPFTALPELTADNPSQYHETLALHAAGWLLMQAGPRRDLEQAKIYLAEFESIVGIADAETKAALE